MSGWTLRPFIHSDEHEKQTTLRVRGEEELSMVNLFTHSFNAYLLRGEVVGGSEKTGELWTLEGRR